jgi:hypothetical protein
VRSDEQSMLAKEQRNARCSYGARVSKIRQAARCSKAGKVLKTRLLNALAVRSILLSECTPCSFKKGKITGNR